MREREENVGKQKGEAEKADVVPAGRCFYAYTYIYVYNIYIYICNRSVLHKLSFTGNYLDPYIYLHVITLHPRLAEF